MTTAEETTEQPESAPFAIQLGANFNELRRLAHKLALQKFDEASGDKARAHKSLMQMMEERPDVAEVFLKVAYDVLWREYLHLCSKNQRKRIGFRLQNGEDSSLWNVPETLGEGLTAKRQNMDTIYDYQFPYLNKKIGLATKTEFGKALLLVVARHDTDKKLIDLGETIIKRIKKANKNTMIQDIVSAGELARLFRQAGVVT